MVTQVAPGLALEVAGADVFEELAMRRRIRGEPLARDALAAGERQEQRHRRQQEHEHHCQQRLGRKVIEDRMHDHRGHQPRHEQQGIEPVLRRGAFGLLLGPFV
jgi:hypothetical protein